jgi:poly-gamma-glutamate synthesis protein (capsule biosynthesis protein)
VLFLIVAFGAIGVQRILSQTPLYQQNETQLPSVADPADAESAVADDRLLPMVEDAPSVRFIAVGDIMLSRTVAQKIRQHKDQNYPFLKVTDALKSVDVVFANLETPITPGRTIETDELVFRSDPSAAQSLRNAGVSVVSLANNHVPNFGEQGILDTVRYLDGTGVQHAGAGKDLEAALTPAVIESHGLKLAFLAFNDTDVAPASYGAGANRAGTALINIDRMTRAVEFAKTIADLVIVSMHAGVEYAQAPNVSQQKFARAAIDAGADLVIGHHPHVVQTVEKYKGKWILYSLGNFVFDQMWSTETRLGLAANMTLTKDGVQSVQYMPLRIDDYSQPNFLEGEEADQIRERLKLLE